MNKLQHLPEIKQKELKLITELIAAHRKVEMVVLFGSYARDSWVEDRYIEKGILYEYKSDFDILVVLTHDNVRYQFNIEGKVEKELVETGKVKTRPGFIFHGIKHLNKSLAMGNYFFRDIKKEGIVLYDTGRFSMAEPKILTPREAQTKAQEYFDKWYTSASDLLETYKFELNRQKYNNAAFMLHQVAERFYTCILLIFTDYRPKEHDLKALDKQVSACDKRFAVFPQTTNEEKHLFELLRKAYIDARYKMDEYSISKNQLESLAEKVEQLKELTTVICREKIREIGGEVS